MRVAVLVLDGVFDSGLSVLLDTLEVANSLAADGKSATRFDVTLTGLRAAVKSHQGFKIDLARAKHQRPDLVLVPAIGEKKIDAIERALARPDVADAARLLASWSKSGARVAGACTATFVVAASGLLDGGRATTTWWLSPLFRERFPGIDLDESRMVVESGRVVTAGAALAHVDLALFLLRRKSPALADQTARYLVFDERPSQASYVLPDHLEHADPVVERFERWARKHLAEFDLAEAAKKVGTSARTLERRTRAVLGKSPLAYVRDLRVEVAVHRLRTTKESLEEIAAHVGYADAVSLRALLREKTGKGLRELRAPR